jgi:hypothetical protein
MLHLFHRQFTPPPNSLASVSYGFRRLPAPEPQNSRTRKQQGRNSECGRGAEMAGRFVVPGSSRVSSVFGR